LEFSDILTNIDESKDEIIKFCQNLIKIDSVNPPGNEIKVAKFIHEYFEKNDIQSELIELDNNRANIIATIGNNNSKRLLYNGHMDVVPVSDESAWKSPPFEAKIRRNKIIGRGAADMKGGLASMIMASIILKRSNYPLNGRLIINCVSDEEKGGKYGTKYCIENYPDKMKADAVIIGEPTGLEPLTKSIIIGEKGRIELELITKGIPCHASLPYLGKNPIEMFMEILNKMPKIYNYLPQVRPPFSKEKLLEFISEIFPTKEHVNNLYNNIPIFRALLESLTNLTYSCTMINSGIKENVVPNECRGIFDIRLLPGHEINSVLNSLKNLINDIGYPVYFDYDDLKIKEKIYTIIKTRALSEPSIVSNYNSEIINILKDINHYVYKKKAILFMMPASTDAFYFRNTNFCPDTIIYGPGGTNNAHSINEYIEIDDLINATKVYALTAVKYLK